MTRFRAGAPLCPRFRKAGVNPLPIGTQHLVSMRGARRRSAPGSPPQPEVARHELDDRRLRRLTTWPRPPSCATWRRSTIGWGRPTPNELRFRLRVADGKHGFESRRGFGQQTCFRLLAGWPAYPSKVWPLPR